VINHPLRVVVSDTSPLRYLILIGALPCLESLYGQILLPGAVRRELAAEQAPEEVQEWMRYPPKWIKIVEVGASLNLDSVSSSLHLGEREVIG
jgi:predicted nucleic acid-binding protein